VTIPSQIRYVKYFESFLETNFYKPYIQMIPKILKIHFGIRRENVLLKFMEDNTYFVSPNIFILKEITIGPFANRVDLNIKICDFRFNYISVENILKNNVTADDNPNQFFFKIIFKEKLKIESDIKISVSGGGINFYVWANLWYSSYSCLKEFLDKSKKSFVNKFDIFFKSLNKIIHHFIIQNRGGTMIADNDTRLNKNKIIEIELNGNY